MGTIEKAAGDERGLAMIGKNERSGGLPPPFLSRIPLSADDPCRPLAFSIVLTD